MFILSVRQPTISMQDMFTVRQDVYFDVAHVVVTLLINAFLLSKLISTCTLYLPKCTTIALHHPVSKSRERIGLRAIKNDQEKGITGYTAFMNRLASNKLNELHLMCYCSFSMTF